VIPLLFSALLALSLPLAAAPISPAMHAEIMLIADRFGIPRSSAHWHMIEESGDRYTGAWGNPRAVGKEKGGFKSHGLFAIYDEPKNLLWLLDNFWYGAGETDAFDWYNPIHNATLAFRYMAYLHRKWGTWEKAYRAYNCGWGELWRWDRNAKRWVKIPQKTIEYARRIVNARAP
jgi:hypothetical protein